MKRKLTYLLLACFMLGTQAWALSQVDDVYQIGTAQDLADFAALVNGGETGAKAVLTADIDMKDVIITGIGTSSKRFVGTFDGQGHTISNLVITRDANDTGLFNTGANVVLRDFFLDSKCTITGKAQTGIVGNHNGKDAQFIKIGSAAKIVSTGGGNVGGLIGGCWCGNPGTVTINSCWTIGSVSSSGTNQNNNGLFIGWSNQGTINLTNCWTIGSMNHWENYDKFLIRYGAKLNFDNCYTVTGTQVQGITTSDVASGRLCFLLNKGNTTSPEWYQTIGVDAVPTLNNTHGIVYAKYNLDCDGATPTEGSIGYANEATAGMTGATSRAHNYSAGVCTQCGQTEANANVYTISTAEQFRHFAHGVEAGNRKINATLASDIDLSELTMPLPMIGTNGNYYSGTFDGQGYAIHNFSLTSDANYAGLISYLYGGTVKNFSIDGTMNLSGKYPGGVIGQSNSVCTISGIHSTVDFTTSGPADDRLGGIIGYANGSKTTITDCTYGGTITVGENLKNSVGGIIGGGYNNLNIDNCVFYGKLVAKGVDAKGTNFGGMIGYMNSTNMDHMKNCISAGTIELDEGRTLTSCGALIASHLASQSRDIYSVITGCYWTDMNQPSVVTKATPDDTKVGSATKVTVEQATSGELTYTLNGNSSEGTWRQTIGTDAAPLPISSREKVFKTNDAGWATFFDTENAYAFNGLKAYTGKIDGSVLKLTEVTQANAGTPVILEGTYYNKVVKATPAEMPENDLKGAATDLTADGTQYVLAKKDDVVGFYQATSGTIAAGKAYILYAGGGVKGFTFGTATSIASPLGEKEEATVIYDLSGRRVEKATKGLYIINGKKVLK